MSTALSAVLLLAGMLLVFLALTRGRKRKIEVVATEPKPVVDPLNVLLDSEREKQERQERFKRSLGGQAMEYIAEWLDANNAALLERKIVVQYWRDIGCVNVVSGYVKRDVYLYDDRYILKYPRGHSPSVPFEKDRHPKEIAHQILTATLESLV